MRRHVVFYLLISLPLILLAEGVGARIRRVPSEYETIQRAIDFAVANDTVLVDPGVYRENLVLEKTVSLIGAGGASKTTVDGGGDALVLKCRYVDSTATIQGFTFRNGAGVFGGGLFLGNASPAVRGNVFTGDSAKYGGGLCALWSNSIIEDNRFIGNRASYGGGIYTLLLSPQIDSNVVRDNRAQIAGGVYFGKSSEATFRGNRIVGNHAETGGGTFVSSAMPVLEGNLFRANSAEEGGAISSRRSRGIIRRNTIWENIGSKGAAIALVDTVAPAVEGNTIVQNSDPDSLCAGIYCSGAYLDVTNNILADNSPGYAVYCLAGATPVLSCNILWSNETGNYYGVVGRTADLYEDPLFCAPDKGDFSVRENSIALTGTCGSIGAHTEGCKAAGSSEQEGASPQQ